jgi:diaminohydroxyphosphoribosylaminopyrimidine deaminase/5-amino-6-(5-phosphoribosylamino)uracil reductase
MTEAIDLALRGRFRVEPNPMVGAVVLAADGTVAGRGFHARWGGPHAECAALQEAGERARGGTLVVTLEPCAHTGKKTPPCVPQVLASGVARVVIGADDPNPETRGKAAAAFSEAGVACEAGPLRDRCEELAARAARQGSSDVPWTIAKWAMSADGRIADAGGHSRWITEAPARDVVHELRATVDAVVVGRGTVLADDPLLTCRLPGRTASPLRVVLDTELRVAPGTRLVTTARETPTLVLCAEGADPGLKRALTERGADVTELPRGPGGRVKLAAAFRELHRRGVRRALLEAGAVLTGACLRAGYVRQVAAFVAPVVIGGAGPTPFDGGGWPLLDAPRLEDARATAIGSDALLEGYWPRPGPTA